MTKELPEYICTECAKKQKGYNAENYGYTFHGGICPLCGEQGSLATLKDFGIKPIVNGDWD